MNIPGLTSEELYQLIERVFKPADSEKRVLIMVDLPDEAIGDHKAWRLRRSMAARWFELINQLSEPSRFQATLCFYRNVGMNNADLPETAWLIESDSPLDENKLDSWTASSMEEILSNHRMILALTEFSATAPLKILARKLQFRAATMGGFSPEMVPALRLDYTEINRRVQLLKDLLDRASSAEIVFLVDSEDQYRLNLDLRHRKAHASGGLLPDPGTAGNLPSGEAYIVPYEGEIEGQRSLSSGTLPVQFEEELVIYEIGENRARSIRGEGAALQVEKKKLAEEPAYGNLAELGLGVLDDFGIRPCGSILLDEKLGLHLAFGRSDHFGGAVGAKDFNSASSVVHIDRVYIPSIQPRIEVSSVDLRISEDAYPLMEKGKYQVDF